MLGQAGFPDDASISVAQDISVPQNEILEQSTLAEQRGKKGPAEKYFAIMVAKKNARK